MQRELLCGPGDRGPDQLRRHQHPIASRHGTRREQPIRKPRRHLAHAQLRQQPQRRLPDRNDLGVSERTIRPPARAGRGGIHRGTRRPPRMALAATAAASKLLGFCHGPSLPSASARSQACNDPAPKIETALQGIAIGRPSLDDSRRARPLWAQPSPLAIRHPAGGWVEGWRMARADEAAPQGLRGGAPSRATSGGPHEIRSPCGHHRRRHRRLLHALPSDPRGLDRRHAAGARRAHLRHHLALRPPRSPISA